VLQRMHCLMAGPAALARDGGARKLARWAANA
jgi:hypothetical protein